MFRWDPTGYCGNCAHEAYVIVNVADVTQEMLDACGIPNIDKQRKNIEETKVVLKFKCTDDLSMDPQVFSSYDKYSYPQILDKFRTEAEWTSPDM